MKQMKFLVFALTLLMGFLLTSCLESEERDPEGGCAVKVYSYMGTVKFETVDGLTIIPTPASYMEVADKFNFSSSTQMAYIGYSYKLTSAENADYETTKKLVVTLNYAISIEAKVESTERGASADSISTSPIIQLTKLTDTGDFTMLDNGFLITGIDYLISQRLMHNISLIHYESEETDGEFKFYLRHTGTPETDSYLYSTVDTRGYYPFLFYYAFDVESVLRDYKYRTGNSNVKIIIEADVNSRNAKLDDSSTETRTYSLDYQIP